MAKVMAQGLRAGINVFHENKTHYEETKRHMPQKRRERIVSYSIVYRWKREERRKEQSRGKERDIKRKERASEKEVEET